jgi:Uri superfamily endonuclease
MLVATWYRYGRVRREHVWARVLRDMTGSSLPLPGFGSSDCKCDSHLFYFPTLPTLDDLGAKVSCAFRDVGGTAQNW